MNPGPGVWVTGPSRSGTSMVAGLLAAHGVFFGQCGPGDEHNEKGYWEHPELVSRVEAGIMANWPDAWWKTLETEGYGNRNYWGIKRGPDGWPWVRQLFPALIITCKRPTVQIVRSRARRWPNRQDGMRAIQVAEKKIRHIEKEAACPVITVNTAGIVQGDYQRLAGAMARLGVWFDPATADEWIDAALWDRGPTLGVGL